LPDSNISPTTLEVFLNTSVGVIDPSNYTFNQEASLFIFNENYPISAGDIITWTYKAYKRYTDLEIRDYIASAIIRLSVERYYTFALRDDDTIFPTPIEPDENLICFIASVFMEGNLARYRTNEVEIEFGRDEDNESRIKRTIRQFKKTYGVIDYVNIRKPYTQYIEENDITYEELP
jgi:hypothetical protein